MLAATRALAGVHESTIRGLREVDVLVGAATPRAIERAVVRERDALRAARSLVATLEAVVEHDQRVPRGPAVTDPPNVADLGPASTVHISTGHLVAVRAWNSRERRRLRAATGTAAARLVELLRADGHAARADLVASVWCAPAAEAAGSDSARPCRSRA